MAQIPSTTLLRGGLNLITPAISVPPGHCIGANNYEPEVRGYRRISGYDRKDGQPEPYLASYYVLGFTAGSADLVAGDIITGAISGAMGIVLANAIISAGSSVGSNAVGLVVLYNSEGTFQSGEDLKVSAVVVAVADGAGVLSGALTDEDDKTWFRAAVAARRSVIAKVPGIGPILGVWVHANTIWAVRDNIGKTESVLHRATTAGWVAQSLGSMIDFNAGTAAFTEGETLTQGAVTATIDRIVLVSGSYAGANAAGYMTISSVVGGNFAAGIATSVGGSANMAGAQTVNSIAPGGRFSFFNHNFFGAGYSERMYGANGKGRAFSWNGAAYIEIRTGLSAALDKPTRVVEFSNHLFLGYSTGSVLHSGTGKPLSFAGIDGAGEFTFGEEVTNFIGSASTSLVILGRKRVSYLIGNDINNFELKQLADDAGADPWTAQTAGSPIYHDVGGVRRMTATQDFGGWAMGTLSAMVEPLLKFKREAGVKVVASMRNRAKNQYRLFYSDGTGITVYLGGKKPEILPFEYGFVASCTCSGSVDTGTDAEILLAGAEDGYVYQLDVGTSFDGDEVNAFMLLPFNSVGSPMQRKRFHKATLELDAGADTVIGLTAEYGYGLSEQPAASEQSFSVQGGGALWNIGTWNVMYWSAPAQGLAEADLEGVGRNCAIGILSDATHEQPHTLSSLTLNFTYRGLVR